MEVREIGRKKYEVKKFVRKTFVDFLKRQGILISAFGYGKRLLQERHNEEWMRGL